jgi:hypothetical protein
MALTAGGALFSKKKQLRSTKKSYKKSIADVAI